MKHIQRELIAKQSRTSVQYFKKFIGEFGKNSIQLNKQRFLRKNPSSIEFR